MQFSCSTAKTVNRRELEEIAVSRAKEQADLETGGTRACAHCGKRYEPVRKAGRQLVTCSPECAMTRYLQRRRTSAKNGR